MPRIELASEASPRYRHLDAWRGAAAIVVVLGHMGALPMELAHHAVLLFFVISGYCIAASTQSSLARRMPMGTYLWRRLRRIYPPFLASIFYYLATRALKLFVLHQPDRVTELTAVQWVQNFTMTQWLSLLVEPRPHAADNPTNFLAVYWSLNDEEQFYLVLGLAMVLAWKSRVGFAASLLVVTACSVVYLAWTPWLCRGLFFDVWLMFAAGVVVHRCLCVNRSGWIRRALEALLGLGVAVGITLWFLRGDPTLRDPGTDLAVASAFALLLLVLRPVDDALADSRLIRPLAFVGTFSYSLYLIHQANLNLVDTLSSLSVLRKLPTPATAAVGLALHLCIAYVFFRVFERPFMNRPLSIRHQPVASGVARE